MIIEAGEILKRGGLVAFPTETVYGLGADALNEEAAQKIYAAKGRPSDNPLIVHITNMEDLLKITKNVSKEAFKVAEEYWPGPLTMIFEKKEKVPYGTPGGLNTVAVRMPSHEIARAVIDAGGGYIAAPSANTSGRPSPTAAEHVKEDMDGRIDMIVDGGDVEIGVESTILDMTVTPPMILRPGAVTKEMLEDLIGEVAEDVALIDPDSKKKPKAPGMKYRHYAPKAKCILVYSKDNLKMINKINEVLHDYNNPVVIACTENIEMYNIKNKIDIGSKENLEEISKNLFTDLRKVDKYNPDIVIIEGVNKSGMGLAIMNRLIRACEYNYIEI